jgi:hypothetical protein
MLINEALGQSQQKNRPFNQKDFDNNKIFDDIYHLQWYKNRWFPNTNDTIPYFVDDRNYKGIINYGVTFRSRDNKTFSFVEDKYMCFLKVEFNRVNYNPKESEISIEGTVSGGWNDIRKKVKYQNNIDIFIGEKKDTINVCRFGEIILVDKEIIEVKLDNKEIDQFTVLDTFPSFYLKNYTHYRTVPEGKRPFKIKAKVNPKTILAFGGRSCYSEIFNIGSMIYTTSKKKKTKGIKTNEIDCKTLIIQNKLVSSLVKDKTKKETNYYNYTQKAENYILSKQYAKAKETYSLLANEYQTLFTRDIHNAIRCAILSRDFKTAFIWSEKMASKSVEQTYFNSKVFNGLRNNLAWKSFSIKYDSILKYSKSKWNLNLKQQVQQLLEEDQSNYGLANRKDSQTLYETTERVTNKLILLLQKEGFPTEEKVGSFTRNDTILIQSPDYNVIIRHAIQQKPKGLPKLMELLNKSEEILEYDKERSSNHKNFPNACLHIYKGNLYNNKSCAKSDLMINKINFKFNNPYGFIMDYGDFIVSEYNKEEPKEWDDYYENNFDFIMKLTDDWEFYEKN